MFNNGFVLSEMCHIWPEVTTRQDATGQVLQARFSEEVVVESRVLGATPEDRDRAYIRAILDFLESGEDVYPTHKQ